VGDQSPLDEPSKSRYRTLLALVGRNQQGTIATDFTYTLANGTQGRLHKIDSPFTLLWFYDPGCGECAQTKADVVASGYLDMLHSMGAIEVLAVYADGDVAAWRKAQPERPDWWIWAYDKGQVIQNKNLYDLKAKLFRFAAGRGFEANLALKTIDKILNEKKEELSCKMESSSDIDFEMYDIITE
jgi:hypothetical protein